MLPRLLRADRRGCCRRLFFPEKEKPLTAKDLGKQRLSMILVADRSTTLSPCLRLAARRLPPCLRDAALHAGPGQHAGSRQHAPNRLQLTSQMNHAACVSRCGLSPSSLVDMKRSVCNGLAGSLDMGTLEVTPPPLLRHPCQPTSP